MQTSGCQGSGNGAAAADHSRTWVSLWNTQNVLDLGGVVGYTIS